MGAVDAEDKRCRQKPSQASTKRPRRVTSCRMKRWISSYTADNEFSMWNGDPRKAFRGCPIFYAHIHMAWVIWLHQGVRGRLFRCQQKMRSDYRERGTSWLAHLVGRPVDSAKSVDQIQTTIIVLGANVTEDFRKWCVRASVGEETAKHWRSTLEELVATKTLEPRIASKCAGRLSFAVRVAADKCGQAYTRPFHAQAHAPQRGVWSESFTRNGGEVVLQYLAVLLPTLTRQAMSNRKVVRIWTDAASNPSSLAALTQREGRQLNVPRWYWRSIPSTTLPSTTLCRVPQ